MISPRTPQKPSSPKSTTSVLQNTLKLPDKVYPVGDTSIVLAPTDGIPLAKGEKLLEQTQPVAPQHIKPKENLNPKPTTLDEKLGIKTITSNKPQLPPLIFKKASTPEPGIASPDKKIDNNNPKPIIPPLNLNEACEPASSEPNTERFKSTRISTLRKGSGITRTMTLVKRYHSSPDTTNNSNKEQSTLRRPGSPSAFN